MSHRDQEAREYREALELILAYTEKDSTDLGKVLAIKHVAKVTLEAEQ